jgi:ubiquinone/menaquinone biosynthesis C-methylase UbiE
MKLHELTSQKAYTQKSFDVFQKMYIKKYPGALRMRELLPSLKNISILDVGCGSGIDIEFFLSQKPKKVAGIDISKELTTIARKRNPDIEIKTGSFRKLPWDTETLDIVYSKYTLQIDTHISKSLTEVYRVLKKDGLFFLQVTHPVRTLGLLASHNYFNTKEIIMYPKEGGGSFIEPHHTVSEWINAIIATGFTLQHSEEILNRKAKEYVGTITPSAIIFVLKK